MRLALVIELLLDRQAELLQDDEEAVTAAQRGVGIEEGGDLLEHLKIFRDLLADVGALHLHGHRPAIPQGRAVHLSQRGGGKRLDLETQKRLGNPGAQFGHDRFLHLVVGKWFHLVLQPLERLQVGVGQPSGRPASTCPSLT